MMMVMMMILQKCNLDLKELGPSFFQSLICCSYLSKRRVLRFVSACFDSTGSVLRMGRPVDLRQTTHLNLAFSTSSNDARAETA